MKPLYDVIIVGAGPAGAFCSYKLAKQGLKVLLLEAKSSIKRKVCGEYLSPLGVDLLEEEGVKEILLGDFLPIKGMKIVPPDQNAVHTVFPNEPEKNCGIALNRQIFDEKLIALAQSKGVQVILGKRVQKILPLSEGWNLECNTGEQFSTGLLIGADGRNSFVAKALGLKSLVDTRRVALHCHIQAPGLNTRFGEMHILKDGSYIGVDPVGEYEVNLSLVCNKDRIKDFKNLNEQFNHYLQDSHQLFRSYGSIPLGTPINSIAPITNQMNKIIGPNFALIGDAGGFLDPLTGEGMFNGLWMAKKLSDEIQRTAETQYALSNYEREKKRFFRHKKILNRGFQFIIKKPLLCKLIAKYLNKKQKRADIFIGIIGNIYRPIEGLIKLIIA